MYCYFLLPIYSSKKLFLFGFIAFLALCPYCSFADVKGVQKIITPHFSIGFSTSMVNQAQRIANTLETLYGPVSKTLAGQVHPIRVWINNQSSVPEGRFTQSPRHLLLHSFYVADPNFIGNADWLSLMCIHELRHVVQYAVEYYSIPFFLRHLYAILGIIPFCGVASFFHEGDAVGIETALSKSGRGRLPGWEKLYKVNLLEREPAGFTKQLFGSLQYDTTSEYHLGYYFTTHIRRKYGVQAIKAIYEKSIRGIPYFGFYGAIKAATKKSILQVYSEMQNELLLGWKKQLQGLKITPAVQLTHKKSGNSFHYINPFIDASGNLIAWKHGIGVRSQLVILCPLLLAKTPDLIKHRPFSCQEKKMIYCCGVNTLLATSCAIGEGCAAWLETCSHPWKRTVDNNSVFRVRLQYYDFKRKKRKTLVQNGRYHALAISPNTGQLVVVASDDSGKHYLVVLETKSGKVIKKIDNPDDSYYLTPSWSGEDHIVVVKTKAQKNSIVRINLATDKSEILLPFSYEHRNSPRIYKGYLLYNSSYNGIDNIYAMHLPTNTCFQVTSRKYGAYLGMVDSLSNQLVFSDYSRNGMAIAAMPFDPLAWIPIKKVVDRSVRYYAPLVTQECNTDILEKVPDYLYPIKKYSWWKDDLAFSGINLGLNELIPFSLLRLQGNFKVMPYVSIGFDFIRSDCRINTLGVKLKYQSFYPIFEADISRRGMVKQLFVSLNFPYYFSLDSSYGSLVLGTTTGLSFDQKSIKHIQIYNLDIKNATQESKRDIVPSWYQGLSISFKKCSTDNTFKGIGKFFVPGIGPHHYFRFSPSYKHKHLYSLKDRSGQSSFTNKLVYGLPLAYPDWEIPSIWFLKMVYAEGYYSNKIKYSKNSNLWTDMKQIIGIEIYFLHYVISFLKSLKVGLKFCWTKQEDRPWSCSYSVAAEGFVYGPVLIR